MIEIPQLLGAKLPAVLFSGGKDSLLLLDEVRRIRPGTTIIHFYDRLHPQVGAIIKEWDLEVLSWRPAVQYIIPWRTVIGRRMVVVQDSIVLVSEYSFGDARLPVLQDVVDGGGCQLENRRREVTEYFDNPFDTIIWGMKESDELHPVMPSHFASELQLGTSKLVSPLYEMTDAEVLDEIRQRELPYEPFADVVTACGKCREWLARDWDRGASLNWFAERFGYRRVA